MSHGIIRAHRPPMSQGAAPHCSPPLQGQSRIASGRTSFLRLICKSCRIARVALSINNPQIFMLLNDQCLLLFQSPPRVGWLLQADSALLKFMSSSLNPHCDGLGRS